METKEFKIVIDASKEKVWNTLWDDNSYREWTSVFAPGSHAQTDWRKGSKVLFLDGQGSGMVSVIEDAIPNEFMSFKHLGEVKDSIEDTESERVKKWSGALENYRLKEKDGKTELTVYMDMDSSLDFMDFLLQTWPKALEKLKEVAERSK
jgi:hypothetical protein